MTSGVLQHVNPLEWQIHRFGLSPQRWASLEGKTYWITGAGTGYGRAMAVTLALAGAHVFLSGRREEKLRHTLEEAQDLGASVEHCHVLPLDLTREDQIEEACTFVRSRCTSLQGLINNAAMPQTSATPWPLQEEPVAQWDAMMRLNVVAPWLLTRTIFPHMVSGREARVLFMSSGAGWAFTRGFGQYNVSKAALNSLGASLAEECAARYPDKDIQINILEPGEARTEMNRGAVASPYSIVSIVMLLLSHPPGGPNGRFFHRDGRPLAFAYAMPWTRSLGQE